MLTFLKIENYALIDKLEIDFSKGLSVITGETGAGKSILLGALSLILGQRFDNHALLKKSDKCFVEGSFNIKNYGLEPFFELHELDFDNDTILRREITPQGKSRAFINDTPVTLNILKDLGDKLVDIHSQLKTLTLNESDFQLAVVDSYAKNNNTLRQYKNDFLKFISLKNLLNDLKEQENKAKTESDYQQFLFDELDKASLLPGEQTGLETELELLNNSEIIKKNLFQASFLLDSSDNNLIAQFTDLLTSLNKIAPFHPAINDVCSRLQSCKVEIKDISKEIEHIEKSVNFDPERIENITQRLNLIYSLQKKHRVNKVEELIEIKDSLSGKLQNISSLNEKIEKLGKELTEQHKFLIKYADSLSSERKKQIPAIEKEILAILKELAMPDAQFKIQMSPLPEINLTGKDKVSYLFNANKGGGLDEIAKIASGGELSRLMLSVKSIIAQRNLLPTIIFDEIDIGVSGDIASKVGNIIQKMSKQMQVIAITHQPQIAAKGDIHYLVYKSSDSKSTRSAVKKLNNNERIEEIAQMISGLKTSKPATATAKEMLNS